MAEDTNETLQSYEFGGYRLSPDRRRLLGPDGEPITLRGKVFDLLLHLIAHRGQVVEKAALMDALWPNVVVDENNLNQAMTALRHALDEKVQAPRFIATITGRGYQFIGDVRVVEDTALPPRKRAQQRWPVLLGGAAVVALAVVVLLMGDRPTDGGRTNDAPPSSSVALDRFDELSPRLVTDFHGSHSQPTLSPDGTMMAWLSDIDGTAQVWVSNLQEGNPIQITRDEHPVDSPSWSPDGGRIIYHRRGPRWVSIYSVDALGTSPPRLLLEGGANPSYARQSDEFVFTRGRSIWVSSGDASTVREIENLPIDQGFADRTPALSPDGSMIAFVHAAAGPNGNLWVIETTPGAEPRQLTAFDLDELQSVDSPAFTPDGREVVFSLSERNGTAGLWRVSVDGGDPVPLTTGSGTFNFPVVSSDGKRIAYTDRRQTSRLIVFDPDTGERRTIYESRLPIVLPMASPGGGQITFFSLMSSGAHVMTIAADGRSLRQRTSNDGGMNTLPMFGDDEDSIYYFAGNRLTRQYLDEGRTEVVLDNVHWSTRNWNAVYEDRIAYHQLDRTAGTKRAAVQNLAGGTETELPVPLEGMTWSRDGRELLGFTRNPQVIVICLVERQQCETISGVDGPVRGYLPRWSRDEQRIYFLRSSDNGECCDLRVISRDGSDSRLLTHLDGFDPDSSFIGVTDADAVFYNMVDGANDEIWLVAEDSARP